jgi:enterochelin esterase-like enzyme
VFESDHTPEEPDATVCRNRTMQRARTAVMSLLGSLWLAASALAAPGTLSDNQIISSQQLGYRLQYRVYTPDGYDDTSRLPAIYVADGQWYIESGQLPQLLDRLIEDGSIEPTIAVFVDSRSPDNLDLNRRNQEFFCNEDYAQFYSSELIPAIDQHYRTRADRESRVVLGMSFGGLNSACFGLHATEAFGGIAMQSPAMHPVRGLHDAYADSPPLPLRIFLSTGTENDNEASTRRLHEILEQKGYEMRYREVPQGHNWRNWRPLLDDVLTYFFSP